MYNFIKDYQSLILLCDIQRDIKLYTTDIVIQPIDLTGFNRIAIHFPCVGSWMAPDDANINTAT